MLPEWAKDEFIGHCHWQYFNALNTDFNALNTDKPFTSGTTID
jgi:hypothetical protein